VNQIHPVMDAERLRSKQTQGDLLKDALAFCHTMKMSFKGDWQWLLKRRKSNRATVAEADKRGRRNRAAVPVKRVAAEKVAAAARAKEADNPAVGNPAVREVKTRSSSLMLQNLRQRIS
jgi:hypothetical protein